MHYVQVVADEDVGQAKLGFQVGQQVEHLGFHRLVEGRNGLIQDDHARLQGQGTRNIHALALATRQLVRIALGKAPGGQAHAVEQVACPRHGLTLRHAMHLGAKGDGILNGQARVERGIAVLKHHLHLTPELLERQVPATHGAPVINDLPSRRRNELHQQPGGGRLAAARLAHHAQGFALEYFKAHAIHRTHGTAAAPEGILLEGEVLDQPRDGEQRLRGTADVGDCLHRFSPCCPWPTAGRPRGC